MLNLFGLSYPPFSQGWSNYMFFVGDTFSTTGVPSVGYLKIKCFFYSIGVEHGQHLFVSYLLAIIA